MVLHSDFQHTVSIASVAIDEFLSQEKAVLVQAQRIAEEFQVSVHDVRRCVEHFIVQLEEGLAKENATIAQIPSFVRGLPTGKEKGIYLAVDLGGSNCRVCSVELHGDRTFSVQQTKVALPKNVIVATKASTLFSFVARQIESFLQIHYNLEPLQGSSNTPFRRVKPGKQYDNRTLSLAFTFSFTFRQIGVNVGILDRWDKGFQNPDVVGKDVCALLQQEINNIRLPVLITALTNDTVSTLMTLAYTSANQAIPLLGAIFGTGTNGAYVERLSNIKKLGDEGFASDVGSEEIMIMNTEWGSFDNDLAVLPVTPYDIVLDAASSNPKDQVFEKRVSGMYLGEIFRLVLLSMLKEPGCLLFRNAGITEASLIHVPYAIDTSVLSIIEADMTAALTSTIDILATTFAVPKGSISHTEALAVKKIVHAIGKRAALLSGVAIAAVVLKSGRLRNGVDDVMVAVEGSLVEHYPNFEEHMRSAIRQVREIGPEGEKRVRICGAKDGSGVGGALVALLAERLGVCANGTDIDEKDSGQDLDQEETGRATTAGVHALTVK